MKSLMLLSITQSVVIAWTCTSFAQPSDYRITEPTQACESLDAVHTTVEDAKRGIRRFRLGCTAVAQGTEVRLIAHVGDVAQVVFCTVEGCLRRWVLTSVLGPNGV